MLTGMSVTRHTLLRASSEPSPAKAAAASSSGAHDASFRLCMQQHVAEVQLSVVVALIKCAPVRQQASALIGIWARARLYQQSERFRVGMALVRAGIACMHRS